MTLSKLTVGDQVAVISPSAGLPAVFPWVQDLGLKRMRDVFGLVPVEYPTTRVMNAPLEDRARDIIAAYADNKNKAVFASIGGSDQIKLIKYLEPDIFVSNPKPFFGYSDNTHLHNFLWNLGIASYYGGSIMTQFGMNGAMFDITIRSLKHALFDTGEFELDVAEQFNDEGTDWSIEENLSISRKMEQNDGLFWDGDSDAEGVLWGGCVESLIVQAATNKYLPTTDCLDGAVLALETAEDIPEHWIMEYLLTGFGERGWLDVCSGILVGRPKTWEFDKQYDVAFREAYRNEQRETVVKIVRQYNKKIPIVQNIDFGHTDPQVVLPLGRNARLSSAERKVFLSY